MVVGGAGLGEQTIDHHVHALGDVAVGEGRNGGIGIVSGFGLDRSELFGERLLPVGTLYDPFIARGLDALNYACYQDSRFLLVATPSGVSLAGEGGAHQSISSG